MNCQSTILLTIFLASFGFSAGAQDWSPLNRSEKFNFNITGVENITNTIRVDSAKSAGQDSVFYFNRIVIDCDTCTAGFRLSEQPDFLLERMVKHPGGDYNFRGPGSMLLKTLAKPGDSYLFDTASNITAQVMNFTTETVLGENDLVKEFHLSNGFVIRLSKNHGILQWPSDPGNGWYYLLTGIEGRNLGQQMPKFRGIYNFNPGDIFQYESKWMSYSVPFGGGGGSLEKIMILSKDSSAGHYCYQVLRYSCSWPLSLIGTPGDTVHSYEYDTLVFTDSVNHPANYYPNEIIENPVDPTVCGNNTNYFRTMLDAENVFTMYLGTFNTCNGAPTFRHGNVWSPPLPYFVLVPGVVNMYVDAYKTGLGLTLHKLEIMESEEYRELVGYVKNGDTTGIIYPDDLILQGIKKRGNATALKVFPNPAGDMITLDASGLPHGSSAGFLDLSGRLIKECRVDGPIDVSDLPEGIYFIQVTDPAKGKTYAARFVKR